MEKKIIGYKAPMDLCGDMIKAGTLFIKMHDGMYHIENTIMNPAIPPEIVETWEAVYEDTDLTKDWYDLGAIGGWFIATDSTIRIMKPMHQTYYNKNLFATKKQVLSALAFAQLSQIVAEANSRVNWQADWNDIKQTKYCIYRGDNALVVSLWSSTYFHLTFHSLEAAEESLRKHKSLWEQYWEL